MNERNEKNEKLLMPLVIKGQLMVRNTATTYCLNLYWCYKDYKKNLNIKNIRFLKPILFIYSFIFTVLYAPFKKYHLNFQYFAAWTVIE
jgi:hypothetical protein